MVKKIVKLVGICVLVGGLATPMLAPSFAQEDSELSEEEQALLERAYAAIEVQHTVTSIAYGFDMSSVADITVNLNGEETISHEVSFISTDGYLLRADDVENSAETFSVDVSRTENDVPVNYVLNGESIFVDGTVYVQAGYASSEGEVEEIPEGWQVITSADEIPSALADARLDTYFDDEDFFDTFVELSEYAAGVELSTTELEDGTPLDVVAVTLSRAGFEAFATNQDDTTELMLALFAAESAEGELIMSIAFDENNLIYATETIYRFSISEFDLTTLDASLEDSIISLSIEFSISSGYAEHNAEFDPIVAPEIEAEEE